MGVAIISDPEQKPPLLPIHLSLIRSHSPCALLYVVTGPSVSRLDRRTDS